MAPGIYIYRNSICGQIISDALHHRIVQFGTSLKQRGITIELFEDKAKFTVLGVRTVKLPQKALKSWSMLENWLESRITAMLK